MQKLFGCIVAAAMMFSHGHAIAGVVELHPYQQREVLVLIACNNPVFIQEIFRAEKENDLDRANSLFADRAEELKCAPVADFIYMTPKNFLPLSGTKKGEAESSCVERTNINKPDEVAWWCMIEAEIFQPTGTFVDDLTLNPQDTVYTIAIFEIAQKV